MQNTLLKASLIAITHVVLWCASVPVIAIIFAASPARLAYGILSAWWINLYAAALIGTTWRNIPLFVTFMILALAGLTAVDFNLFYYHDWPPMLSTDFISLFVAWMLLWSSPVLVNEVVVRVRDRLIKLRLPVGRAASEI